MYKILEKETLNPSVKRMSIDAPLIAKRCEPGQFVIVRAGSESERIPLTIAGFNRKIGTVDIIYQVAGAGTMELDQLECGDSIQDLAGPLGKATETEGLNKVCIVGGGVGCAIACPVARKLHEQGCTVHTVAGFRNSDMVLLEKEFRSISDKMFLMTDDGSAGEKGLVTTALRNLIENGEKYDRVIAIGPLIMMKKVCEVTKEYGVPTIVSMNPIMIDGTGMCGGCRLTVGGKTCFACVDGPEFDGHEVDFDEAMSRGGMYREFEKHAREEACNLFQKEGVR